MLSGISFPVYDDYVFFILPNNKIIYKHTYEDGI